MYTVFHMTKAIRKQLRDIINIGGWDMIGTFNEDLATLSVSGFKVHDVKEHLQAFIRCLDNGYIMPSANVNVETLDDVFCATQSLANHWSENEAVEMIEHDVELALSSLSVGDVVRDNETGKYHVVQGIGFSKGYKRREEHV